MDKKEELVYAINPQELARKTRVFRRIQKGVADTVYKIEKQTPWWESCPGASLDSAEKVVIYCRKVLSSYFGYNHLLPPDKTTQRYKSIAHKISTVPSWETLFKRMKIDRIFMRIWQQKMKKGVTFETFFPGMYELLWDVFEPFQEHLLLSAGGKYENAERCVHLGRVLVRNHFWRDIDSVSLDGVKWMNWQSFFIAQQARWLMHVIGNKEGCFFPDMWSYLSQVFLSNNRLSQFFQEWDTRRKYDVSDRVDQISASIEKWFEFSYADLPRRWSERYCKIRSKMFMLDSVWSFCEMCGIPGKISRLFSSSWLREIIQYCCYYFVTPEEWPLMIRGDANNRDFRIKRGKMLIKNRFSWMNKEEILKTVNSITAWQTALSEWWFGWLVAISGENEQFFSDIFDYLDCIFDWLLPRGFFDEKRPKSWKSKEQSVHNVRSVLSSEYGICFEKIPGKNTQDYLRILHFLWSISFPELLSKIGCSGLRYGSQELFRDRADLLAYVFRDYWLREFHFSRFGKILLKSAGNNFGERNSVNENEAQALDTFFEDGDIARLFSTLHLGTMIGPSQIDLTGPAYERFALNMEAIRAVWEYHPPRKIFKTALVHSSLMKIFLKLRQREKSYEVLAEEQQERKIIWFNNPIDDINVEALLDLLNDNERQEINTSLESGTEFSPRLLNKIRTFMGMPMSTE